MTEQRAPGQWQKKPLEELGETAQHVALGMILSEDLLNDPLGVVSIRKADLAGLLAVLMTNPQVSEAVTDWDGRKRHDHYERALRTYGIESLEASILDENELPPLPAGVYQHYKGHPYLVLGYGRDSNDESRRVVVYVGLDLEGARSPERIKVRSVKDFFGTVLTTDGAKARFSYLGPGVPLAGV